MFLEKNSGNGQKDKISSLLTEITRFPNLSRFGFTRYMDRLGKIDPKFFDLKREKNGIKALVKFNPDFASMLKKLGWSL